MKKVILYTICFCVGTMCFGQQDSTAEGGHSGIAQNDPSQFLSRVDVFNELQHRANPEFLNSTTIRTVIAVGRRFTTRLDVPFGYNSISTTSYAQSGLGDISVRLLGYKIVETRKAAMLASVELSFNTAQSPLLGTGKNIISPVVAYAWRFPKSHTILATVVQQFYSLWGDESRADIRWTKLQFYYIQALSKRTWTMVLPEMYLDHRKGNPSMNLEGSVYYRISPRFTYWIKGGAGLFGDHPGRYDWTAETGVRYLMMKTPLGGIRKIPTQ